MKTIQSKGQKGCRVRGTGGKGPPLAGPMWEVSKWDEVLRMTEKTQQRVRLKFQDEDVTPIMENQY